MHFVLTFLCFSAAVAAFGVDPSAKTDSSAVIARAWSSPTLPCWKLVGAEVLQLGQVDPEQILQFIDEQNEILDQALERIRKTKTESWTRLDGIQRSVSRTPVDTLRRNTIFPNIYSKTLEAWEWLKADGFQVRALQFSDVGRLGHRSEFTPVTVDMLERHILLNFLIDEHDPWLEMLGAEDLVDPELVLVEAITEAVFMKRTTVIVDGEVELNADFQEFANGVLQRNPIVRQSYLRQTRDAQHQPQLTEGDVSPKLFEELHQYFLRRAVLESGLEYYNIRILVGPPAYSARYGWFSGGKQERMEMYLQQQFKILPLTVAYLEKEQGYRKFMTPARRD